jgi:hypothetical protein
MRITQNLRSFAIGDIRLTQEVAEALGLDLFNLRSSLGGCRRTFLTARDYCGSGFMGKAAGLREDELSRSLM